eukprot:g1719.t1
MMKSYLLCLVLVVAAQAASPSPASKAPAPSPAPAPAAPTAPAPGGGEPAEPCEPCSGLGCLFVDVTCHDVVPLDFGGDVQLLFLMGVYAYILFMASNLISDGSELLLLIPSIAGIVGSVVLPVLGAVPDGAIVLFAGLGQPNRAAAQKNIAVGVGALAGSTIMLLTIPWCLAVFAGRVDLIDGNTDCAYNRAPRDRLRNGRGCCTTGVKPDRAVFVGAVLMMITSIPYLIIEIPALIFAKDDGNGTYGGSVKLADDEAIPALVGLIACVVLLIGYLGWMVRTANAEQAVEEARKKRIQDGTCAASLVLEHILRETEAVQGVELGAMAPLNSSENTEVKLDKVLVPFFNKFDADRSGSMDRHELRALFAALNEPMNEVQFANFMKKVDKNGDGQVDYEEFKRAMIEYSINRDLGGGGDGSIQVTEGKSNGGEDGGEDGGDDDDEEEEEMPEDIKSLPTLAQQMRAIKWRAAWQMALGTALVVLVSDPMVDCLSELGVRTHIPGFYVSFVIAPLASNASELIAAYNYAAKRTKKTITISLSTLTGAACMNNTFCLGIFLALMYFVKTKDGGISWDFTSETISILFVQVVIFGFACVKIMPIWQGFTILSLFPFSIVLVALLDATGLK